jgi:hypothetical protein
MNSQQKRYLWCQTKEKLLLGTSSNKPIEKPSLLQKIIGKKYEGQIFEFAETELTLALECLHQFMVSPYLYSIESLEGGKIDIYPLPEQKGFYLDCWLSEGNNEAIDGVILTPNQLETLISFIYENKTDVDIEAKIRAMITL